MLRRIQCSQSASLIIMGSIVCCRVALLVSGVDTVRATQVHVNTECLSFPCLFVPEIVKMHVSASILVYSVAYVLGECI